MYLYGDMVRFIASWSCVIVIDYRRTDEYRILWHYGTLADSQWNLN